MMTPSQGRLCLHALLGLLLYGLLAGPLLAEPVLLLSENFKRSAVGEYVEVLEDRGRQLDLRDIQALPQAFKANEGESLALGVNASAWWLRLSVHNPDNQPRELVLDLGNASLAHIRLYSPDANGLYQLHEAGSKNRHVQGDLPAASYWFQLHVPAARTSTYYLRIEGDLGFNSTLYLGTAAAMASASTRENTFFGLGIGIILGLALYNLMLLYRAQRDQAGLFYALFLFSISLFLLSERGIMGVLFFPIPHLQNFLETAAAFLGQITATLFVARFLHSCLPPRLQRAITLYAAGLTALMLFALAWPGSHVAILIMLSVIITSLLLLAAALLAMQSGFLPAYYYVVARLYHLLIVILASLAVLAWQVLPLTVTWMVMSAICFEALMLAIGLAERARLQRNQQQQRREAQLVATAAAEAKRTFLAQMSHEIRTPMSGIIGMTELLMDTPLAPNQREYANTIHTSSNSLLRILNDILDHSKMEAGTLSIVEEPFDLAELLGECLDIFKLPAESKNLELIASLDPALPTQVIGDPTRLRQVISNLLRNAIKYTPHGEVEIILRPSQRGLYVEVRDTGIGIPSDHLAHVFLAHHENAGDSPQHSGTGIGLSICKQLVELMGGEIGARSKPKAGSVFWFDLPLQAAHGHTPPLPQEEPWWRGLRLLVVDDNHTITRVIQEQASHWGMHVVTSDNGNEALALARNAANLGEPFDIILLDHNMPGMTGLQLAARIKEDAIIRNDVIVIMLTGINIAPTATMTRNVGIRRVLSKPVTERQLKTAIAEELGHVQRLHQEQPQRHNAASNTDSLKQLQVLIAEDNHLSQKVIRGMLNKLGVSSTVVANGREVVEEVSRHDYDIVLMDCDMPFMDGYAATQAIREWEKLTHRKPIPILALTAHTLEEHKHKSHEAGMNEHLSKPIELSELQDALLRWAALKPQKQQPA